MRKLSKTYRSWTLMKQRCLNTKAPDYARYGGRGISIDPRWINSFDAFLYDMGERFHDTTLDRINNDGPYCKDNCRWATAETQANNKGSTILINYNGEFLSLTQWGKRFNLKREMLYKRFARWGNNPEKLFAPTGALMQASQDRSKSASANKLTYKNKTQSITEWAQELGVNRQTMFARYYHNWPIEQILFGRRGCQA